MEIYIVGFVIIFMMTRCKAFLLVNRRSTEVYKRWIVTDVIAAEDSRCLQLTADHPLILIPVVIRVITTMMMLWAAIIIIKMRVKC